MTAPHDLTALEQRDALRGGDISSKELTEHYLARIDRYDEQLGAFVEVTADLARIEAAKADDALHAGDHSPLLGMPIAFKDLHFVAGVPITMGSTAIDPMVMPVDAWTVGLLRQAGSVTLGTTHAPEFGAPCYTHSDVVGRPAVTPYDTTRYAAGSSGGAAAAVAAGLLPAAHGSDGAGSIRLPAAACGLVGLKPTRGRVSTAPLPSFQSWTTEGPLTRTVADAGLLLDVMANPPASELHRRGRERDESFLDAALSPPPRHRKIAVWTDNGLVEPTREIA
jgi:amidase